MSFEGYYSSYFMLTQHLRLQEARLFEEIFKGLSGNMFSSFKGGQTERLMVFSGQNWYQRMHFLYAEALVKAKCLIIPIFID